MVDLRNPTQIVEMLAPWSADRCDGESRFAPSAPAVADLDCSPEDKAEFFAKVLIEKVVLGMIEKGEDKARDLLGLADALKGALDQDARPAHLPESCVLVAEYGLALCSALRMMVDPDPRLVEECSCLSSVRKLISGDQEIGFPWDLFGDALGEHRAYWEPRKTQFQKNRIWDLENAPAIRASIDALKAAGGMTVDNLKGALELVGKLSSYCRSGGLKPLEDLIDSGISRLIADLVSRVDSRTPQEARDIVGLITSARSKAGSGDAKRLAVLEDLAAQSDKASHQILSERSSTAIWKALDTYANQNTNERFQELREAFDGAKGMVFAEPAHVATIAQGARAIMRRCHSSIPECSIGDKESTSLLSDLFGMGVNLVGLVSEPTAEWKAMQAWFSCGRAHVAVLETSAEFKDLGDSSGERWEAEAGHDAWSKLHAALVELGLEEWSTDSADDRMFFEEFVSSAPRCRRRQS